MSAILRLASRQSALALTQTRWVAAALRQHWPALRIEEVHVTTTGDRIQDRPLAEVGGKGLFVGEVQACLREGRADVAVHSLKDVPGDHERRADLQLVCFPVRAPAEDVLVTAHGLELDDLEAGSRIGTSSARRVVQLSERRPDLAYVPLRGNVDTRLARVRAGHLDGAILAAAGLARLGLLGQVPHRVLHPEWCIPAVGQGSLALEIRAGDEAARGYLLPLRHWPTHIVTAAERSFLRTLEGNCHAPMAGHARLDPDGKRLSFHGLVASPHGEARLRAGAERFLSGRTPPDNEAFATALGREVAEALLAQGAQKLMLQAAASALDPRLAFVSREN
ncbi:MAG: hydroxymethylbilane synthase [Polyangiales bacterium]